MWKVSLEAIDTVYNYSGIISWLDIWNPLQKSENLTNSPKFAIKYMYQYIKKKDLLILDVKPTTPL